MRGHAVVRLFLASIFLTGFTSVGDAENRFALVIGNAKYRDFSGLKNPTNDSRLIARVLSGKLGYKVFGGDDLDRTSMLQRIETFAASVRGAGPNSVALIYYAGHGMEVADENYLLPIDAVGPFRRETIDRAAVSLTHVVRQLQNTGSRVQVVILDACRNDGTRSPLPGFRTIGTPLGSIVVYSTAPGKTASDGTGTNSPFTEALAELILTPGHFS